MSSKTYHRATADFAVSTRTAKRVLIIEIAGLGDLVHSLPAMWAVRCAYPDAELHCLALKSYAGLLDLAPWIDRVLPYSRGHLHAFRYQLNVARMLRAQHYDVVINLVGSDYASAVGWISGAKRRLVRKPGDLKPRYGWHALSTDVVEHPFRQEPMYLQRWKCLAQAGLETAAPEFRLNWQPDIARTLGLTETNRPRYIHVSPFTRGLHKQMPLPQMVEMLTRLHQQTPQTRLVISCASNARECLALDELLAALPFEPWKSFSGTLDIPQLCAVIQSAALHLSGDTGSMHLAWLVGTASVSWFLHPGSIIQWAPSGPQHATVVIDAMQDPAMAIAAIVGQALGLLGMEPPAPQLARPLEADWHQGDGAGSGELAGVFV
ncbi:MAG: putative Lipopolysaccharide heptosyltransferase [Nevskia sp.]|nr:putative Lipopolysaccharide heptosyltransferase [Nevskia sp.]